MKISSKLFLVFALVVCASLGAAGAASACYSQCAVDVNGCGVCESPGYLTGYVCVFKAPCHCEELPGVCAPPQQEASTGTPQVSPADLGIFAEPEAIECSATVEAAAE